MATNISGSGDSTFGGTIQSTGIDDNATSTKLTTTSTGIDVTGTVTATAFTGDGSALTGISTTSDKIEEGNSSVEVVDTGTGYVAVTVDGSERMRIDSSGRVTMPYQPSFKAYSSGISKNTSWQDISSSFSSTVHNVGSNYNTSNGRFTAPVDGTYVFFFGGWANGNTAGARYASNFQVNGSGTSFISGGSYCSVDSPMDSHTQLIELSTGDYVSLTAFSAINCTWGGGHTIWWGGYLIG